MKITAAVAREHGQPLTVEELELDDLQQNEVRVRMVSVGICHTDAVVRDGIYPTPLPAVLGHEGAGVVEAVGSSVRSVVAGDHVVLGAAYCGYCRRCRAGEMAYCENLFAEDFGGRRRDGTTSLKNEGEVISSHFFGQSAFATYANVVEESVIKVDKDVPLEHLGPLGCGFNTGAGTVLNELQPPAGSSILVFGTGAVGSAAIMAAAVAGAPRSSRSICSRPVSNSPKSSERRTPLIRKRKTLRRVSPRSPTAGASTSPSTPPRARSSFARPPMP